MCHMHYFRLIPSAFSPSEGGGDQTLRRCGPIHAPILGYVVTLQQTSGGTALILGNDFKGEIQYIRFRSVASMSSCVPQKHRVDHLEPRLLKTTTHSRSTLTTPRPQRTKTTSHKYSTPVNRDGKITHSLAVHVASELCSEMSNLSKGTSSTITYSPPAQIPNLAAFSRRLS
ncbi:hypothetical protein PAXRUDRAFT_826128 [Paxillus rubicundulus Ve08.2h10]|uniref:Uncharacterized protein n=1 Tax=Paxillus rubicundulus Ve08.2h10 TaxID=930991 RepID=A0A0D0DF73_9AGAM|nr:hypothetical protein PAXRUDRAFT_826128 [Paxillus rubicundulus Ve08.2h10]